MSKKNIILNIKAEELKKKLNIQDGKTPTKEEIINIITPLIPKPEPQEKINTADIVIKASKLSVDELKSEIPTVEQVVNLVPILGEKVRDSLEILPDGEKLNIDAIQNLRSELDRAKREITQPINTGFKAFRNLTDAPHSYKDQAGKVLKVKANETGLEFGVDSDSANPGGSDKQIQFNDGGAFGGQEGFEYDKATSTLTNKDAGIAVPTPTGFTATPKYTPYAGTAAFTLVEFNFDGYGFYTDRVLTGNFYSDGTVSKDYQIYPVVYKDGNYYTTPNPYYINFYDYWNDGAYFNIKVDATGTIDCEGFFIYSSGDGGYVYVPSNGLPFIDNGSVSWITGSVPAMKIFPSYTGNPEYFGLYTVENGLQTYIQYAPANNNFGYYYYFNISFSGLTSEAYIVYENNNQTKDISGLSSCLWLLDAGSYTVDGWTASYPSYSAGYFTATGLGIDFYLYASKKLDGYSYFYSDAVKATSTDDNSGRTYNIQLDWNSDLTVPQYQLELSGYSIFLPNTNTYYVNDTSIFQNTSVTSPKRMYQSKANLFGDTTYERLVQSAGGFISYQPTGDKMMWLDDVNKMTAFGLRALQNATNTIPTTGYENLAIGLDAGREAQTYASVFIGQSAGVYAVAENCLYIGFSAGASATGYSNVGIGNGALRGSSAYTTIAIGADAAAFSTKGGHIFIGVGAGYTNTGSAITAIGNGSAYQNTADSLVAFGYQAGYSNAGINTVLIGYRAGQVNTGAGCFIAGHQAGLTNTGGYCTMLGNAVGYNNKGFRCLLFGNSTAENNEGDEAILIGQAVGTYNKGDEMVAIGSYSAVNNTGNQVILFGKQAGYSNTGNNVIAIGNYAGTQNTGNNNILIGDNQGKTNRFSAGSQLAIDITDRADPLIHGFFASRILRVNGSLEFPYVAKTGTYGITDGDYTIDCTANTFNVTLPTAVGKTGRIFNIKNSGTGTITVLTTSSQTIDGASSFTLIPQLSITVQSTGNNYIII